MEDGVLKALDSEGTIEAVIVSSTNMVEEARKRHKLSYTATAALGRALTGAVLVSQVLPQRRRVSMKFKGSGPLGKLIVEANSGGSVRGYVENPQVELPLNSLGNFDVGAALGSSGYLHVTVDDGAEYPQTSSVELVSGEIGEDINHYLVSCYQRGCVVIVGVHLSSSGVEAAGGLLVQLLPDHTEESICKLENNLASFGTLTFLMRRGMGLEEILRRVLQGFDIRILKHPQPVKFDCRCSKERFIQALKVLDKRDLIEMAESGEDAEGRCHFCNAIYHVGRDRLIDIAEA